MAIRAVLFDLDNTLCPLSDYHREVLNQSIIKVSGPQFIIQAADYDKMEGLPTRVKLELLSKFCGLPYKDHEKIRKLKQEMTISVIKEKIQPIDNITEVLEYLSKNKYKLACVSNSVTDTIKAALDAMKIYRYIDTIVSNQMVINAKPAPDGYLLAMSKFGVSPKDCLVCEDNAKGLRSAFLAGANIMEVRNPADLTLRRIQEFIEVYS